MQNILQPLDRFGRKRRKDMMRSVGSSFQNFQTVGIELLDHIAYRLVIAAQCPRDSSCRFFVRACQHNLTPAHFESIARAETHFQPLPLFFCQFSNINRRFHTPVISLSYFLYCSCTRTIPAVAIPSPAALGGTERVSLRAS